ncbi:hypothetical protein [Methanobacterium formicicum]|uniref:hypothetical protein n=1 Tax=Methanobacterium formicicum TaxID=2162 RepID=UPI0024122815|nr:hypothetical protein [Methanobacterium formicicum]MDG3547443.1 hypothetical protein [Methanobacterium formicicum]
MLPLVDVSLILKKNYILIKKDSSSWFFWLVFIFFPLAVAMVLALFKMLSSDSVNVLVTAFTIFSALLPNIIFIQFDILKKNPNNKLKENLAESLYVNSVYALLISIFILALLVIFVCISSGTKLIDFSLKDYSTILLYSYSVLIYFLVAHFLLNLVMIVRRLYIILFPTSLKKENKSE